MRIFYFVPIRTNSRDVGRTALRNEFSFKLLHTTFAHGALYSPERQYGHHREEGYDHHPNGDKHEYPWEIVDSEYKHGYRESRAMKGQ